MGLGLGFFSGFWGVFLVGKVVLLAEDETRSD